MDDNVLLKVFGAALAVVILILATAGINERDIAYEEGQETVREDVRENPGKYGMIYKDEAVDYIMDAYAFEDIFYYYEEDGRIDDSFLLDYVVEHYGVETILEDYELEDILSYYGV